MSTARTERFYQLWQQCLAIAHSAKKLDQIAGDFYLYGFEAAPGVFIVALEHSQPKDLAGALAIREVEFEASAKASAAVQAFRLQDLPAEGGLQ